MVRLSVFLFSGLLSIATAGAFELSEMDVKVGGYVDGGRFQLADTASNGEVLNRMGAKWAIDKEFNENWSAAASLHWMFWRNQATDIALFHIAGLKFDSDVQGAFSYRSGPHRFKLGLYEFKYNPDSKNLGEYLLRSEAYPTIVENSQGKDLLSASHSRVAGIEYGLKYALFRQTGLVYAEQHTVPVNDISLAYLAAAGPEYAEVGIGAALHRQFRFGIQSRGRRVDSSLAAYAKSQGLETQAVKLSLRGRLDLGTMLGMAAGSFKLYSEAALLGLKNDTLFYKNAMERLPVMAGLEIPTYGFLNTLSAEVEYFRNPYHGWKYPLVYASSPLPYLQSFEYAEGSIPNDTQDDWKWSIYMHKALNNWIDVKLRFASDHLRLLSYTGEYAGGGAMTKRTGDWYFLARIEYHN